MCKAGEKSSWKFKISELQCKLIDLHWNKKTRNKKTEVKKLQIKQMWLNTVKLLPIGTIEPVVPQNDILEQNMFYYTIEHGMYSVYIPESMYLQGIPVCMHLIPN